jgi:hypothetical protein
MNPVRPVPRKLAEVVGFPAIVSIITIIVGVILSEVKSVIGWGPVLLSLLAFLSIYVVTLMVIAWQYRPLCVGLLEELKQCVGGVVDPSKIGIIDIEGLKAIELLRKDKEIWLVTGDLAEDVPGGPYFDVVHKNLKRGVRNVYFCPRSAKTEGRVAAITQAHGSTKGQIVFAFLPDDFFFLTTRLDFCIYDPLNTNGTRCGYMGLPMDTEQHVHAPMNADLIDSLVGKLAHYVEKEDKP